MNSCNGNCSQGRLCDCYPEEVMQSQTPSAADPVPSRTPLHQRTWLVALLALLSAWVGWR